MEKEFNLIIIMLGCVIISLVFSWHALMSGFDCNPIESFIKKLVNRPVTISSVAMSTEKTPSSESSKSHKLCMNIGRALTTKDGVIQYYDIKPLLDEAKDYYGQAEVKPIPLSLNTEELVRLHLRVARNRNQTQS